MYGCYERTLGTNYRQSCGLWGFQLKKKKHTKPCSCLTGEPLRHLCRALCVLHEARVRGISEWQAWWFAERGVWIMRKRSEEDSDDELLQIWIMSVKATGLATCQWCCEPSEIQIEPQKAMWEPKMNRRALKSLQKGMDWWYQTLTLSCWRGASLSPQSPFHSAA